MSLGGSSKDGTLADSSGTDIERSVWIMAQVLPCEAVVMSKGVLFWRAALVTRGVSVFCKDRLCWLPFTVCRVNFARDSVSARMASGPPEGMEAPAKWSYPHR